MKLPHASLQPVQIWIKEHPCHSGCAIVRCMALLSVGNLHTYLPECRETSRPITDTSPLPPFGITFQSEQHSFSIDWWGANRYRVKTSPALFPHSIFCFASRACLRRGGGTERQIGGAITALGYRWFQARIGSWYLVGQGAGGVGTVYAGISINMQGTGWPQ